MDGDTSHQIEDVLLTIEIIQDSISEVLEKFQGGGGNGDLQELETSTSQVLDLIEFAKKEVGKTDIRTNQGMDLIDCLNNFVELALLHDSANQEKAKKNLSILIKSIKQLRKQISQSWNTVLAVSKHSVQNPESADKGESSSEDAKPSTEKSSPTDSSGCQFISVRDLPKGDYDCDQCQPSRKFTSAKAFKSHMKKSHDTKVNIEVPKMKCMLPHAGAGTRVREEHARDYMATHLREVHEIFKPSKSHFFRGFLTRNHGIDWEPVFLKESEKDPTPDSYPPQSMKHLPSVDNKNAKERVNQETLAKKVEDEKVENEVLQQQIDQIDNSQSNPHVEGEPERQKTLSATVVSSELASATAAQVNDRMDVEENNLESIEPAQDREDTAESVVAIGPVPVKLPEGVPDLLDLVEVERDATVTQPVESVHPEPSKVPEDFDKARDESPKDIESLMFIEDEIYNSDPSNLDITMNEESSLEITESSDIEDEDEDNFKSNLLSNKVMRWSKRSSLKMEDHPSKAPDNWAFREKLKQFVVDESKTKNERVSTATFTTDLITDHDDSFLVYMLALDPAFSLQRLINFNHPDFLELKDPKIWISQIAGQDKKSQPTRRREMLKAWVRLNRFIQEKLKEDNSFGTDLMSIMRRNQLRDNLKGQIEDLERSKIWGELKVQIAQSKKEIEHAEQILHPTEFSSTNDANRTYFQSREFQQRMLINTKIWKKAVETNSIGPRDFSKVGNTVRHYMFLQDRNRSSGYTMTNADYCAKKAVYFPSGHNSEDFDGIPENVDIYAKPHDDAKPDGYIIKVPGSRKGVKLQEDITITVLRDVHEWLCRYRDLKSIMFGDDAMDPEEEFFVNFYKGQRKPFGKMSNYPGSILDEYSKVTNQRHVTTNKVRATLEPTIQGSHVMKTRSRVVGSHSHETGHRFYDQSISPFRMTSLHYINTQEGVDNSEKIDEEVPEHVSAKRRKLEAQDESSKLERAKQILDSKSKKRNVKAGIGTCKLDTENRRFLQKAFSKDGVLSDLKLYEGKFPGVKKFKKKFFRILDGRPYSCDLPKEHLERLLKIEEVTFCVVKEGIQKQTDQPWVSTVESNTEADHAIAEVLFNSLKSYEKNLKSGEASFFKF